MSALLEWPLVFRCETDELVAVVHGARTSNGAPGILVVVGGPQYRVGSHRQFVSMARAFAQAGFSVMRFDYRGMGDSDGAPRTFEHVETDIGAAVDAFMQAVPGMSGVVLWGLCDAASAVSMYARSDRRVRGTIIVNPWVRTESGQAKAYVQEYYGRRLLQRAFWRKLMAGRVAVMPALRSFADALLKARFRRSAASPDFLTRMLKGVQQFAHPMMVLISGRDLTAAEFTALCRDNRLWNDAVSRSSIKIVSLPDADHTFSQRPALDGAIGACLDWLNETMIMPRRHECGDGRRADAG